MLLFFVLGCPRQNASTTPEEGIPNDSVNKELGLAPYTMEEVFGEHNPKMISGVGRELTHEEWYLRCARQGSRLEPLRTALDFFHAQHERYPANWNELKSEGFYPMSAVDPINGEIMDFNRQPTSEDDFTGFTVAASTSGWLVYGQAFDFIERQWYSETWEYDVHDDIQSQAMKTYRRSYPSSIAKRGALLAQLLAHCTIDYEIRRAEMPESPEQMLDGLWVVNDEWAEHKPGIDWQAPGCFMFGIDSNEQVAVAIWRDTDGAIFTEAWKWDPWPAGWENWPWPGKPKPGDHGFPVIKPVPDDFIPETILWTCSLVN